MRLSRTISLLAGWLLAGAISVLAQNQDDAWFPYVVGKEYSATQIISTHYRPPVEIRVFVEGDKIRTETPAVHNSKVLAIVRPDLQSVYWVILATRQMLVIPFDADRLKAETPPPTLAQAQSLGMQTIFGITCFKYRLVNASGRRFLLWVDLTAGTPVKIMAEGGDAMQVFKNYVAGPQDPALFQPPDNFQTSEMPIPNRLPAPLVVQPQLGK